MAALSPSSPPGPRFSVVTPVYEPPRALLEAAIGSVERQTFTDWELLLVDDGSTSPEVHEALDAAAARDPRIRVLRRPTNGGIVAASNDGLDAARGTFVALLDHDDELHPTALERVALAIDSSGGEAEDDVDYVYTDQDQIDEDGTRHDPFYKPDWSPERFRCQMYTNHLSVLRRSLARSVGGFREGYDGSQDFDLILRLTEQARTILHVPEVLYHWRITAASVTSDPDAKPYAWIAGGQAIAAHLERTGFEATVEDEMVVPGIYRLTPALREQPLVSIIIPTGGHTRELFGETVLLAEHCIRSIVERSTYENYEIVLVIDDHVVEPVRRRIEEAGAGKVRTVVYRKPFNFSDKCNVGAVLSDGEHLLFLNDDTEVITPHWIESMLMYSRAPGVGAVGARLLYGDGRLQHVGVALLPGVAPGHIYRGYDGADLGYYGVTALPCNYLAVTGACLLSPRAIFEDVGGFSRDFPLNYNDVDYCLKVREAGHRVVYDPGAELYHHESSSRVTDVSRHESDLLTQRWADFTVDPYLGPNLWKGSVNYVRPAYSREGISYS